MHGSERGFFCFLISFPFCQRCFQLLENSLDAGATKVDIKLGDMGIDYIELSDNGSGIEPSNYETLVLKHHTSKLTSFSDLQHVKSFGFRGEALNALCELSEEILISTKSNLQPVGIQLSYRRNGE